MKTVLIDIETSARPDAEQFLSPIEAPGNYKDPGKIALYIAEAKAKALENAALSAELGRVLCVGFLMEDRFGVIGEDDERIMLGVVWETLEQKLDFDTPLVTFNGAHFDIPFLIRRSLLLGVKIPPGFLNWGTFSNTVKHIDLMRVWQCGDRTEHISLDRLAKLCGVGAKTGEGKDFARLWATDRPAALAYLENDLRLVDKVYRWWFPEGKVPF